MASDKKINELPVTSIVTASDVSVLVHSGTDYQFTFNALLDFVNASVNNGASISFGNTTPQNITGKNGDIFINTSIGSFAQKTSGTWLVKYTIPSLTDAKDGTVLYGSGIPGGNIGNNNDTYIDTNTGVFYNKNIGQWAQVFSMQTGPQGIKGDKGDTGATGANGKTILNGTNNPSNSNSGANGDFYINTNTYQLFGPKTNDDWGEGISIIGIEGPIGPKGDTGEQGSIGPQGYGVPTGGETGQVLSKVSTTDFDTVWIDKRGDEPNGLILGGEASVLGTTLTIQPATWRIDTIKYNTPIATYFDLVEPDIIHSRYDVVYGDNFGLNLITGLASANPVKPNLPAKTVEIAFAFVQPGSISAGGVIPANYATKQDVIDITGDKSTLSTDSKLTLVAAVNEVNTKIGSINQESVILKIFKKSNYR